MHGTTIAVVIAALLSIGTTSVAAQSQGRSVNPESLEFDPLLGGQPDLTEYRVDVFAADSDPRLARPIKSIDLRRRDLRDDGSVRIELTSVLNDVPDGRYVATIRAVSGTQTVQSGPSETFVLSRNGTVADRVALERRERFWTKVGFAIAGGILFVPLLLR
jgi:hypothetical protein